MNKKQLLDLYFMDARSKLLDLAAFMDRIERASGETDFRWDSLQDCLKTLYSDGHGKTEEILNQLSDPTREPVETAGEKGATGAWPGQR